MALQRLDHPNEETRNCIDTCFEAVQVCEWCPEECEGYDHCRACADVLPECAESRRAMAA